MQIGSFVMPYSVEHRMYILSYKFDIRYQVRLNTMSSNNVCCNAFCCAFTPYANFCSGSHEVVLGVHDFDDFDNGGQPEVYDIDQIITVCIHFRTVKL